VFSVYVNDCDVELYHLAVCSRTLTLRLCGLLVLWCCVGIDAIYFLARGYKTQVDQGPFVLLGLVVFVIFTLLSVWLGRRSGIPCRSTCGIRLLAGTVSDNL